MTEATKITIDTINKLIEKTAEAEYQRGYATGLEEERLTAKYWLRKKGEWIESLNKYSGKCSIC